MTDHASSFEEEMVVYMQSKEKSKMVETRFKPALNKRAEDIYSWVNVIVKKDWSFDTVNDEDVRGIIKLSSVCEKTLKTYIHGIGKKVTTSIKNILSDKRFCIVFDGWDDGSSNYYVAIFAVAPDIGTRYINIDWIPPTSNLCERLFS